MKSFYEMCADGRAEIIEARQWVAEIERERVRRYYPLTWWWCTEGRRKYEKAR